ncbi:MAG: outer membrane lipid asymmetry maintenance protein MlaD [Sulfurimicrobium sp.]|nr:outer membrane lipid asymmetry maintenance protein MlaD [Sulfurimicrobium sp.]MDP2963930.1 outer membrane lipid asymmetry maintenance protein MlaD [Sulfurimicrobium sp.]MDZ7656928.1 outer membrane lipid asymmetry maintenance protein MlaD [Sulfurimicrobium sp.]
MERTTIDLWVGLFVLLGLGAILVLALKVGNLGGVNIADSYSVTANFSNIGGLKVRAPVKSAGVVIGRVSEIYFDGERHEAVTSLKLDKQYSFSKDTSASIMTSGLLGEQYIALETGGDSAQLKEGDKIKITQSAVVLESLIGQFIYNKAADGGEGK